MSEDVKLDWSAAEVHDGELTVPLQGELGKPFKKAFKSTVRLLGHHAGWGDVELHKSAVHVDHIESGSEDPLRHHLDSIVIQAAATVAQDEVADEPAKDGKPAEKGPDADMTARFRSFGDGEETAEDADRV